MPPQPRQESLLHEGYDMKLHPDWPDYTGERHSWDNPTPLDDLMSALDTGAQFAIDDIAEVTHYFIDSNEGRWAPGGSIGTELTMFIVGRLRSGDWFSIDAGNDYTGWGCQDHSDVYVGPTFSDVVANGVTTDGRSALGLAVAR